ncbi:MAG: hypothetical protein ABII22_02845 [Candidatus Micrarchaeota archaeon]
MMLCIPNRPGKGLYSGDFHKHLVDSTKIPDLPNPIQANEWIRQEADVFAREFSTDRLKAVEQLFQRLRTKVGTYGINFDLQEKRPDGCFRAFEVAEGKKGCCLEHTFLFLSICNQAGINAEQTQAVGFSVYSHENSTPTWHACGSFLLDDLPDNLRHTRFEKDSDFRRQVLSTAGLEDRPNLGLLMLDFTASVPGTQHFHVTPMSNEDIISDYFNNSGNALMNMGQQVTAFARLHESARLGNELGTSNLASHYSEMGDNTRLLELTDDFLRVSNSSAFVERARVCYADRQIPKMKLAAMRAIQLSRHYLGYKYLGISFALEDNFEAAERAFAKAHELGLRVLAERRENKSASVLECMQTNADLFVNWITAIKILYDRGGLGIDRITQALESHLRNNRVLVGQNAPLDLSVFSMGRFGTVPSSFAHLKVPLHVIINIYLEAGELQRADELFSAIKHRIRPNQRKDLEKDLSEAKADYQSFKDKRTVNRFFELFSDPDAGFRVAEREGYKQVSINREAREVTFTFNGRNFYIGVIPHHDVKPVSINLNAAFIGICNCLNPIVGWEVRHYVSQSPNFAEAGCALFRAVELAESGDYIQALSLCSDAIGLDPFNREPYREKTNIMGSLVFYLAASRRHRSKLGKQLNSQQRMELLKEIKRLKRTFSSNLYIENMEITIPTYRLNKPARMAIHDEKDPKIKRELFEFAMKEEMLGLFDRFVLRLQPLLYPIHEFCRSKYEEAKELFFVATKSKLSIVGSATMAVPNLVLQANNLWTGWGAAQTTLEYVAPVAWFATAGVIGSVVFFIATMASAGAILTGLRIRKEEIEAKKNKDQSP